jgi:Uma2 family endonuclease
MSALTQPQWTAETYLAYDRQHTERHEFIGGQVRAMSGASRRHNNIASATNAAIFNQIAERPCEVYQADMRVHIAATVTYTYPDLAVACGDIQFLDDTFDTLLNPLVLIEVLSPSTEAYDRGTKAQHYRSIPSLQEYLFITQDASRIEHYIRQDGRVWTLRDVLGIDASLTLASIKCQVALRDVYRKVSFDEMGVDDSDTIPPPSEA